MSDAVRQRRAIARLPDAVIHHIAAGEVITGPAAVLKELLENALDANAHEVWIEALAGGLDSLSVGDDGSGIAQEDLVLAVAPHATSKIESTEDLSHLVTLGFRGEALASIATAAQLEIVSATENATGARLSARDGAMISVSPAARTRGTTVTVRDLFAAQPVRRRLMAESRTQNKLLIGLARRYALAWPWVRFSVQIDQKIVVQSSGLGMASALTAVYGRQMDRLRSSGPIKVASVEATAHIADPGFTRGDQTGLLFVVNGRPVAPSRWLDTLEQHYRPLLPARRHPVGVFMLTVDPAILDANIHPGKLDVRIRDEEQVLGALGAALRGMLGHVPADARALVSLPPRQQQRTLPQPRRSLRETSEPYAGSVDLSKLRVIGQLLNTAIIAESPGGLVLIDQHRAEERAIFESLTQQAGARAAQELLVPVQLDLRPGQEHAMQSLREELMARGFRIEQFGSHNWLVRALPQGLPIQAAEAVAEALRLEERMADDAVDRVLTMVACRAAVRRGVVLTITEMEQLVGKLAACEVYTLCPHGSPIVARLGSTDLANHFGWP